jgi:cystine transport system ATP-binding protein
MTMVVVTHKMSFAREAAHKMVFMDQGVIVEAGSPEQLFNNTSNERLKQFLSIVD